MIARAGGGGGGARAKLVAGYLRGDVFTLEAANRFRVIGWMIALLFPIGVLCQTIAHMLVTLWTSPGRLSIEIGIGDGDVFALVFGLLIVVVGHVMYQAIAISEENKSFV